MALLLNYHLLAADYLKGDLALVGMGRGHPTHPHCLELALIPQLVSVIDLQPLVYSIAVRFCLVYRYTISVKRDNLNLSWLITYLFMLIVFEIVK